MATADSKIKVIGIVQADPELLEVLQAIREELGHIADTLKDCGVGEAEIEAASQGALDLAYDDGNGMVIAQQNGEPSRFVGHSDSQSG